MPECECLERCPFFNDRLANMPSTAQIMKQKYCLDDYASCARYRVFKVLGRERVPKDLFPGQIERVGDFIELGA